MSCYRSHLLHVWHSEVWLYRVQLSTQWLEIMLTNARIRHCSGELQVKTHPAPQALVLH